MPPPPKVAVPVLITSPTAMRCRPTKFPPLSWLMAVLAVGCHSGFGSPPPPQDDAATDGSALASCRRRDNVLVVMTTTTNPGRQRGDGVVVIAISSSSAENSHRKMIVAIKINKAAVIAGVKLLELSHWFTPTAAATLPQPPPPYASATTAHCQSPLISQSCIRRLHLATALPSSIVTTVKHHCPLPLLLNTDAPVAATATSI